MQTNHQSRLLERGAAVSFIIVGLVLIGLLIGGVVLIKSRANHVANTPAQTVQTAQDKGKSTKESTATTSEPATKSPEPTVTTPAVTTPAATPAPQTSASTPSLASKPIASTGPTETFATMLTLGFMTAMIARYIQSRAQPVRQ